MSIRSLFGRYQLAAYFVLAYGITWGGILVLLASRGFRITPIQTSDVMIMFAMMALGPSTGGLVMTGVLEGREGLSELRARLARFRVRLRWYAYALLTIPVLLLANLSILSAVASPAFAPRFNVVGVAVGLLAGALEEIGWTGFATPRLLRGRGPLSAGLALGLLWALWHMLADLVGNIGTMGARWPLWFGVFWLLPLPAYRILMTWVYAHTRSLLVSQLMHASYTGWLITLSPATSFDQGLIWQGIFAASLWAMVAVVVLFAPEPSDRQSP